MFRSRRPGKPGETTQIPRNPAAGGPEARGTPGVHHLRSPDDDRSGLVRPARRAATAGRGPVRRPRRRRRHHRRRLRPRRRLPGPAHRRWSSGTTSPRARRRSPRSWSTAACATSSRARSASSTRRCTSASGSRATPRTWCKVLPFLIPMFTGKDGVLNPKLARALGSAMWMYDLTGGARIGKLHERISVDEALAHMPTLRRDRLAASYLYYDAQADDARLTLTLARTAAIDHGAVVANGARLVERRQGRRRRRSRGATVEADGERSTVRCSVGGQRRRRVGRRRAGPRRGHPPRLDPAGQGHPHHRAVGAGAQRHRRRGAGARRQALGLRRAVGRLHLHRHHRHRLRRARSTTRSAPPRTSTYLLRAINFSTDGTDHRRATSSAPGPACARS